MTDRPPAAAAVFEDNVGGFLRQVMPGELVVVLVTLDNLGWRLAEEQGKRRSRAVLPEAFAGDGHMPPTLTSTVLPRAYESMRMRRSRRS